MNLRHRYLVVTIRTLFGALMLFSGVAGFVFDPPAEGVPQPMLALSESLWASGILHLAKAAEAVAGLMLLTGVLPALAVLFLVPVCVGILVINARLAPEFLPVPIVLCLVLAYLVYAYWDHYRPIFRRTDPRTATS